MDQSGTDGADKFGANVAAMGLTSFVTKITADSTALNDTFFSAQLIPAFRWLSVDGGHSFETTLSDLRLAATLIRPGGVVVLDDFDNRGWSGVQDALYFFLHRQVGFCAGEVWAGRRGWVRADYWELAPVLSWESVRNGSGRGSGVVPQAELMSWA